jgi:hypothetical protein
VCERVFVLKELVHAIMNPGKLMYNLKSDRQET